MAKITLSAKGFCVTEARLFLIDFSDHNFSKRLGDAAPEFDFQKFQ